tara:strand:+ start:1521 stop:3275 length:1755 start_codon:yes stop_codon:yes gene_type:complete
MAEDKGDLRTKSAREAIEVLTNKLIGYNRRDTTRQNKILEQQTVTSEKLDNLLEAFTNNQKQDEQFQNQQTTNQKKESAKSKEKDIDQKKKDRKNVFSRAGSAISGVGKSITGTAKGFASGMTGLLKGTGFATAGAGILAGGAGFFLQQLNELDADSIKENVNKLLSIQDDFEGGAGEFFKESGVFVLAMTGIGIGLAVFGIGSAIAGMSDALTKFSNAQFATSIKENVKVLLSISDELGGAGAFLGDSGTFFLAMTGIGLGLAVFGIGSAIAGISDAVTKFSNAQFASNIKANVLTLLSIGSDLDKQGLSFLQEGGEFFKAMSGIGAGLAVFGIGSILNLFTGDDFGKKIKGNVTDLLSITDVVEGKKGLKERADDFSYAMGSISAGLLKFSGGTLISSLADAASGILNFFSGEESAMGQILSIADRKGEIEEGAKAVDSLTESITKLGAIGQVKVNTDFFGNISDIAQTVPVVDALANGGKVRLKGDTFATTIEKGILDPSIKLPEVVEKIKLVQQAFTPAPAVSGVGLGDATATNQELTNGNAGGSTVIDASTNTNTSTSGDTLAMSSGPEPATNRRNRRG